MSQTLYRYRVWCTTDLTYEYVWGTTTPTVCPVEGGPIDANSTSIVQSMEPNTVSVDNFQKSSFGELAVSNLTPILQLSFAYNNHPQLVNTAVTGSGTITNTDHMGVVSTGAAINSTANMGSKIPIKYRPGQGIISRFSAMFTPGVVGSTQMIGIFDSDGIGFGYDGADFGLFHLIGGTIAWIHQTNWNLDKMDGTGPSGANINFGNSKGNVFEVKFQFLGFGGLSFFVENPGTADFVKVHVIGYSNTAVVPNFEIPSFPLCIKVENTTNNTDIIVKSASMMGGVEGKIVYYGPQFTDIWNTLTVQKNIETFIVGWQVKTTFQSYSSKILAYGTKITMSTGRNDRAQILRLYKNSTFTSPVWTDISSSQSVVQKLTSGTWNNDGSLMTQQIIPGKSDLFQQVFDISNTSLYGSPGENLIITLEGIEGSGSSTGSLSWLEDQ